MTKRARGIGGFLSGALLNLAALGGLICLVLVVLAFVFNATLIMFKTGSMGPTIPAGSLALVREIPAHEIRVGDVVTVDRPAALPITHRVTSVTGGRSGSEQVITMKGDANEAEDPAPYTVSTVRVVLASAPGLAYGVVWLSNPWVLAVLALGASALVTWAFWPREPPDRHGDGNGREVPLRLPEGSGRGRHAALALMIAPVALALGGPVPSHTAASEQVTTGGPLTLTFIGDPQAMAHLTPGEPVQWQIGVTAAPAGPGQVRIGLIGSGSTGLGLHATIRSCNRRWAEGSCPGGAHMIRAQGPVDVDGTERPLAIMPAAEERWLLFDLWLEARAAPAARESVQLQVHASGSGDDATSSSGPARSPAYTGADPLLPLLATAGSIVIGLTLAGAAVLQRRRSR